MIISASTKLHTMFSPREGQPSCLHTTVASLLSQPLSQTVPHLPSTQISTLPSSRVEPPLNRMEPSLHSLDVASDENKLCKLYQHVHEVEQQLPLHQQKAYHCISLQHHHHGHSLNYTDLLHHNWHSLTALFLPHYIQHCPRVWVHFPDQSGHCCMQLLLQKKVDQEFIIAVLECINFCAENYQKKKIRAVCKLLQHHLFPSICHTLSPTDVHNTSRHCLLEKWFHL